MVEVRYKNRRSLDAQSELLSRHRILGVDYMPWEHSVERWHAA